MSFNSTKYPTARKSHVCEECGRAIVQGERYSRTAAVWEGDFFTNVACLHCAVARVIVDYADDWYSEGYYGGLQDWLGYHANEHVWSARLAVGALRGWARFDGAGHMPLPSWPWPSATVDPRIAEIVGGDAWTTTDEQAEYMAAWLAANSTRPLTDWERRVNEAAFEHEPPEVDEDTQRGDMANARAAEVYGA